MCISSMYVHCYVHTITVSLPIVASMWSVDCWSYNIMMPFDQLLLPGLAACKV